MIRGQVGYPGSPNNSQHTKGSSSSLAGSGPSVHAGFSARVRGEQGAGGNPSTGGRGNAMCSCVPRHTQVSTMAPNLTRCTHAPQVCCDAEDVPQFLGSHILASPC